MPEVFQPIDWIRILVTFRSNCFQCGKEVPPGQAFWSNSTKEAMHLSCNADKDACDKENFLSQSISVHELNQESDSTKKSSRILEMKCYFCGREAGCNQCKYLAKCAGRFTSDQYCICGNCLKDSQDNVGMYERYKRTFVLNAKNEGLDRNPM